MMPLMTVVLGVVLLGESFDAQMAIGGVIALVGLLLVLRQQAPKDAEQPREMS